VAPCHRCVEEFESEAPDVAEEMLDRVVCSSEQFSFQMCLESGDGSGTFRNWGRSSRQLVTWYLIPSIESWSLSPADRVVTLPGFLKTRQPTKHSGVMSIWLSAISPTKAGSVAQAVPTWMDQLRRDNNNTPPADLWRRSTTCGHSGVTLRSSTRWRRRRRR